MTPFLALVLAGYAVFMVALAVAWLRDQGHDAVAAPPRDRTPR